LIFEGRVRIEGRKWFHYNRFHRHSQWRFMPTWAGAGVFYYFKDTRIIRVRLL
jgi:hypothetical protein